MARKTKKSSADNPKKSLDRAFRAAVPSTLQSAFLSTVGKKDKKTAKTVLKRFYDAASRAHSGEKEFSSEHNGNKLSLLTYLRPPEQTVANKEFKEAKEALLDINDTVGREIALKIEEKIAAASVPRPRR